MALAGLIAAGALALPYVVVPARRAMGLPTYQWDADARTHPFLNHFSSANYKQHDFSDPARLNAWGALPAYRYTGKMAPLGKDDAAVQPGGERDFPEARARLRALKHAPRLLECGRKAWPWPLDSSHATQTWRL